MTGVERQHVRGAWEDTRAFSRAVVTRGGRTAYLAGVVDIDEHGAAITGDAEASARAVMDRLRDAVEEVGGTLADIVTMTVFLTDPRYGEDLVRVRHGYFEVGGFPSATMVTCAALARPELRMEITAIAVLDD